MNVKAITILASSALLAMRAAAACDFQVTSLRTCDSKANLTTPVLGDSTYSIRVDFRLTGTSKPCVVRLQMADQSIDLSCPALNAGTYYFYATFNCPLDGSIPVSANVDPNKVAGDTNYANNTFSGSFTPVAPNSAIDYFNGRTLTLNQTSTTSWSGGTLNSLTLALGLPTSDTFQNVTQSILPAFFTTTNSSPFGYPIGYRTISKPSGSSYTVSRTNVVNVNAVRTNQKSLEAVTWSSLNNLTSAVKAHLSAEYLIESTDASITSFVTGILPTNYRSTMTPAQAARAIFLAISSQIAFQTSPSASAVSTLKAKAGDSAGMNFLYVACLRNIGIPARLVSGWVANGTQPAIAHNWSEMYLPNIGWIPQDVKLCASLSRGGKYAYGFGVIPDLNARCTVQRGTTFTFGNFTVYGCRTLVAFGTWTGNLNLTLSDSVTLR